MIWLLACRDGGSDADHTGPFWEHCPEAPCVTEFSSALADEPGRADWGTQELVVHGDLVYAGAPAQDGDWDHVAVFRLPRLDWLGSWVGLHDQTGSKIAVADIDGDGGAEVLVGRPRHETAEFGGVVHLLPAEPDGETPIEEAALATFRGPPQVALGSGLVIGDVTGDAEPDLVLSGFGTCCGDQTFDPGGLFVYPAGARGDLGPADAERSFTSDYGRWNRTFLFDLDGDGRDELFETNGRLFGHTLPLVDADPDVMFEHAPVETHATFDDTHVLGDVTGDGRPDLATYFRDLPDEDRAGRLYVIPGGAWGGRVDELPVRVDGSLLGDAMGVAAVSGDLDGDGQDDLVVGASGVYPGVERPGRVLVFRGPVTGPVTEADADAIVYGEYASDMFGRSLGVTEVDGDGRADLVIGAQQYPAGAGDGRLYLVPAAALF